MRGYLFLNQMCFTALEEVFTLCSAWTWLASQEEPDL